MVSDAACSALQVERELWATASRSALEEHTELPIYMSGISRTTYDEWVNGVTEAYGAAGADSIRGTHACLAEVLALLNPWGLCAVACLSIAL